MDYGKTLRAMVCSLSPDGRVPVSVEKAIQNFAQQRYTAGYRDAKGHCREFFKDDNGQAPPGASWDPCDSPTTPPRVALP